MFIALCGQGKPIAQKITSASPSARQNTPWYVCVEAQARVGVACFRLRVFRLPSRIPCRPLNTGIKKANKTVRKDSLSTAVIRPNVAERPTADNWDTEEPACSLYGWPPGA